MNQKQILIHYGELSTKGRNKKMFINKLAEHICGARGGGSAGAGGSDSQ